MNSDSSHNSIKGFESFGRTGNSNSEVNGLSKLKDAISEINCRLIDAYQYNSANSWGTSMGGSLSQIQEKSVDSTDKGEAESPGPNLNSKQSSVEESKPSPDSVKTQPKELNKTKFHIPVSQCLTQKFKPAKSTFSTTFRMTSNGSQPRFGGLRTESSRFGSDKYNSTVSTKVTAQHSPGINPGSSKGVVYLKGLAAGPLGDSAESRESGSNTINSRFLRKGKNTLLKETGSNKFSSSKFSTNTKPPHQNFSSLARRDATPQRLVLKNGADLINRILGGSGDKKYSFKEIPRYGRDSGAKKTLKKVVSEYLKPLKELDESRNDSRVDYGQSVTNNQSFVNKTKTTTFVVEIESEELPGGLTRTSTTPNLFQSRYNSFNPDNFYQPAKQSSTPSCPQYSKKKKPTKNIWTKNNKNCYPSSGNLFKSKTTFSSSSLPFIETGNKPRDYFGESLARFGDDPNLSRYASQITLSDFKEIKKFSGVDPLNSIDRQQQSNDRMMKLASNNLKIAKELKKSLRLLKRK